MSKAAVFTMKIEPRCAGFMVEVEASHRPAPQVVRALVEQQQDELAQAEFLQRKVEVARASVRDNRGRSNAEVEVDFAARRAGAADQR